MNLYLLEVYHPAAGGHVLLLVAAHTLVGAIEHLQRHVLDDARKTAILGGALFANAQNPTDEGIWRPAESHPNAPRIPPHMVLREMFPRVADYTRGAVSASRRRRCLSEKDRD